MKIIPVGLLGVAIGLVFFGNQLYSIADCLQPTDGQVTREQTQRITIEPITPPGPPQPQPNLTGEQIDEGLRLKRKAAYPWHVDSDIPDTQDPSESSDENTAPAASTEDR